MGMCLDPTPEMGEIHVEVRSRSVTIYGNGTFAAEDGTLEVDLTDMPKLRAALDQAEAYLLERKSKK